jgi:hypothetical protein
MAFTDAQKVTIRGYLGRPLGLYQYNTQFESMLDKVGSVAAEQAAIEAILAELATVATAIASSGSSASSTGPLKAITGDVEWYEPSSSSSGSSLTSVQYGRVLIGRLARALGTEPEGDYFGSWRRSSNEMMLG